MPYIQRRKGKIVREYARFQPKIAEEFLADDAAELLAVRRHSLKQELSRTARARSEAIQDIEQRTRALWRALKAVAQSVTLDTEQAAQLKGIQDVFDKDIKAVDDKRSAKELEIDALTSREQLDAYDVEADW